jgi:hypothetical protein
MHRGYWGIIAAFGLAVIVFLSLGVGAYFGALNAPNHSYEAKETTQNTSKNERANPSQIDRDRAGLPNFVERIASAPDPENADEREKRDLAAQEAAALWGFWMLVASAAGTVTTMIGTGFLLWQIVLTREAVEDTGKATMAMEAANEIARDGQNANLRAWLKVDASYMSVTIGDEVCVASAFEITNIGQTPALRIWYATKVRMHGVSFKLPDFTDHLQSEQDKILRIPSFKGKSLFPTESERIEIFAAMEDPALLSQYKNDGGDVWFTFAVRFYYESQGQARHTDRYYQIAGAKHFVTDALRGLKPINLPQEIDFKLISGGSIT